MALPLQEFAPATIYNTKGIPIENLYLNSHGCRSKLLQRPWPLFAFHFKSALPSPQPQPFLPPYFPRQIHNQRNDDKQSDTSGKERIVFELEDDINEPKQGYQQTACYHCIFLF